MRRLIEIASRWAAKVEGRDVVGLCGAVLLCAGGERLFPGAGMTAVGIVLLAAAILVR